MEWWGHSKEHGWVVLDRNIASNAPGLKENLLFFRCRDATTFVEKRESWNPPLYTFAPNYIRNLGPAGSAEAAAELEGFKSLWPDHQQQMQQERRETEGRAEAERIEQEGQRKKAARDKKKPRAAVPIIEHAPEPEDRRVAQLENSNP